MNTTIGTLDISADELLLALNVAATPARTSEPGWYTVEELVKISGLGATTIRKRLKALIESGAIEYKNVVRTSLLGSSYHCNAFHIVK